MNFKKTISLILYYTIVRHLPATDNNVPFFSVVRRIRNWNGRHILEECSKSANIEKGADFGTGEGISIGDGSGLGINCRVRGPQKIGNNVMMGPNCNILTSSHKTDDITIPMIKQGEHPKKCVQIGNDCWIGLNVVIMPGVRIGNGCIVGAGSVVTKNVPDFAVVGGVPAKIIKYRN